MTGSKRVIAIDVGRVGQCFSECFVSGFFGRIETQVFQDNDTAVFQRGNFGFGIVADRVSCERNIALNKRIEMLGGRFQAEFWFRFAFGTPEMAHQDQLAAPTDDTFNGRHRHANSDVVRDLAVFQRDIKVHSHEYGLARYIHIGNRFLCHLSFPFQVGVAGEMCSIPASLLSHGFPFSDPIRQHGAN